MITCVLSHTRTAPVGLPSSWWHRPSADASHADDRDAGFRIILDGVTVILAAILATTISGRDEQTAAYVTALLNGPFLHRLQALELLAIFVGFFLSLILIGWRLNLYAPTQLNGVLDEQWLCVKACLLSGLLLMSALYLTHTANFPPEVALCTVGIVTALYSLCRIVCRLTRYRQLKNALDTRNVLIVGTGPVAQALRHHLENTSRIGFTVKGVIETHGADKQQTISDGNGTISLNTLFQQASNEGIHEIFFTTPCDRGLINEALELARIHDIAIRMVPDMCNGISWKTQVEYLGAFLTIPVSRSKDSERHLLVKRGLDITVSLLTLIAASPLLLTIGILVRLESPGPALYISERIGKNGRTFRCVKFRTMVQNAERRKADIAHLNERRGNLFKITNDPRVTRVGRLLRKYSLDEIPQFFNVLRGDMSIVGPRPPLGAEVQKYNSNHLRRLNITPGITGLWQVEARQDPSFDNYISLDLAYIDNWNIWLDLNIMLRTVGVMFAGTGC